jgi:hypothetical protein
VKRPIDFTGHGEAEQNIVHVLWLTSGGLKTRDPERVSDAVAVSDVHHAGYTRSVPT